MTHNTLRIMLSMLLLSLASCSAHKQTTIDTTTHTSDSIYLSSYRAYMDSLWTNRAIDYNTSHTITDNSTTEETTTTTFYNEEGQITHTTTTTRTTHKDVTDQSQDLSHANEKTSRATTVFSLDVQTTTHNENVQQSAKETYLQGSNTTQRAHHIWQCIKVSIILLTSLFICSLIRKYWKAIRAWIMLFRN